MASTFVNTATDIYTMYVNIKNERKRNAKYDKFTTVTLKAAMWLGITTVTAVIAGTVWFTTGENFISVSMIVVSMICVVPSFSYTLQSVLELNREVTEEYGTRKDAHTNLTEREARYENSFQ